MNRGRRLENLERSLGQASREEIASLTPEERREIEEDCRRYAARLLRDGLPGKVLPFLRRSE